MRLDKFNSFNESTISDKKTKLEIGSIVYDNALYWEGKVVDIKLETYAYPIKMENPYPIVVHFKSGPMNIEVRYTLDGRVKGGNRETNPTLSMNKYDRLSDIVPINL